MLKHDGVRGASIGMGHASKMFISASTRCPSPSVNRCYGISNLLPFEETIKYDGTCDFRITAISVYNSHRRPVGLNVLTVFKL